MRSRLAFAALALLVAPVAAQQRLTPADIFQLEYAADPQISPDGQWVVYVRQWQDLMTDRRYSNLWLVRADGTDHRPLTTGKFSESQPRWSPDGKRIAYLSNRDGSPQIYVRWMDGGMTQPVTRMTNPPGTVTWSPDGKSIAFLALVPKPALVVGQPITPPPGAVWAAPPKYTDRLVFRYDGVGEVPTGFVHLFVVPSEGGTARQLTSGDHHHGGMPYGGGAIAWTHDGGELIIPARRGENPEWNSRESELFAVSVKDGALRRLTERFGPDQSPAVSPDGRLIAYTGYDDRKQGYQNTLLYVMNRDGSGKRVLSTRIDNSVGSPVWAADGKSVYVQVDDRGNTKVA
ncbi:MAG: PD40 domain-containing protein, partial [Gemmatimonadetes bacterium]|nr:PD40 domain-containing protein [Gemmatimonadota bacterium]